MFCESYIMKWKQRCHLRLAERNRHFWKSYLIVPNNVKLNFSSLIFRRSVLIFVTFRRFPHLEPTFLVWYGGRNVFYINVCLIIIYIYTHLLDEKSHKWNFHLSIQIMFDEKRTKNKTRRGIKSLLDDIPSWRHLSLASSIMNYKKWNKKSPHLPKKKKVLTFKEILGKSLTF